MSSIIHSVKRWLSPTRTDSVASDNDAHIITRDQHSVSRKSISENALKVLYRLRKSGYEAFLVGGGVRDILLGFQPKDFDIATDATPEQVRKIFRNSRVIGRRFKIAHVVFGRDIIEVATFRSHCTAKTKQGDDGIILRDNVYGTIDEDAQRRDFTINALYYNINDFSIHDYCNGLADLEKRQLRMIGDPETRYREDPVRMLRAVRLSVKLGLTIEESTKKPIAELANLLEPVSAARLWEEYQKMLLSCHGEATFLALEKHNLLTYLFPMTAECCDEDADFRQFSILALKNTDERLRNDKSINPAFLMAVLLWKPLLANTEAMQKKGVPFNDAFFKSMGRTIEVQNKFISIPRRFSLVIRDIWALQLRLQFNYGKKAFATFENPRFRAAYDFLVLRSKVEPEHKPLADWWTQYQDADEQGRRKLLNQAKQNSTPNKKRSRPRRRKPSGSRATASKSSTPKNGS